MNRSTVSKLVVLIGTNGVHEAEHILEKFYSFGVFGLEFRITDVAKTPVQRPVQVCNAGGDGRPDIIQSCGRVMVGLESPISSAAPCVPAFHLGGEGDSSRT